MVLILREGVGMPVRRSVDCSRYPWAMEYSIDTEITNDFGLSLR